MCKRVRGAILIITATAALAFVGSASAAPMPTLNVDRGAVNSLNAGLVPANPISFKEKQCNHLEHKILDVQGKIAAKQARIAQIQFELAVAMVTLAEPGKTPKENGFIEEQIRFLETRLAKLQAVVANLKAREEALILEYIAFPCP